MAGERLFFQVLDEASIRDVILTSIGSPFFLSFMALATFYHVLAPLYPNVKQASWILTTITSAVMTVTSVPFLWDYFVGGWSVKNVRSLPMLSVPVVRFFQAHLAADLALGSIYYRSRISLLEGWVHHLVYIGIVEIASWRSWSHIFCLCAVMELPTFVLGFTTLFPHLRSNVLFAASFFMTRIMLHVVLGISYLFRENRIHATDGSFLPAAILGLVFPLHVSWFVGCVRGFVRRAAQKRSTQPIPVIVPDSRMTVASAIPESVVTAVHNTEPPELPRVPRRVPSRLRHSLSLKLLHRRQSFERIFRTFRPASRSAREWIRSTRVYGLLPPREVVFHYVGLGRGHKSVPLTPVLEKGNTLSGET